MRTIEREIQIDATCEAVWAILTDFAAYPSWNPFIHAAHGAVEPGAKLEVVIAPPGHTPMTLRPRVLEALPGQRLRWLGHLLVPGIFDGEHLFELSASNGGCLLRQSERFRGVLVALLGRKLFDDTAEGFALMNAALKPRAEQA